MIPTLTELKTVHGGDMLAAIVDTLRDEAQRIRGVEEAFRPGAWDEERASVHHAICAAAELIERLRSMGEDASRQGRKPSFTVLTAVDVARSALIIECERQSTHPAVSAAQEDNDHAVAA